MDRLSTIELELQSLLQTIDAPTSAVPGVYNYYSSCGQVNIEDEVLSLAVNVDNKLVNYCIYLDDAEINNEWSLCQSAYTNSVPFKIVARVHLLGSESNPKFAINQKMNEVLSDIKYALGTNYSLNGKCNWARYVRSIRNYNESNNRIMTAELEVYIDVNYSQSLSNPDIGAVY